MPRFHKFVVAEGVRRIEDRLVGRAVLEVGCGDGFVTSLLAERAKSVVAFDLNPRAIEFARLIVRDPDVRFEVGRAGDLASVARETVVEVVAAFEVFEHLSTAEREEFLDGVIQVLRPLGGTLIMTTPNGAGRTAAPMNPHHAHEFSAHELTRLLRRRGFDSVEVTGLYRQPRWPRLEHIADVVPFRALFRRLARAGRTHPDRCRTLVCTARVPRV